MIKVRDETPEDHDAIRRVLIDAFPTSLEADLVERLRTDGDAVLSLVAEADGKVVGHIMFSRLTAPMTALGLAPVAVASARQGQGVGSALIREGLERARDAGYDAVFVLGDPAYYRRFAFSLETAAPFASPYAGPHFMALALQTRGLPAQVGAVAFPRAFQDLG